MVAATNRTNNVVKFNDDDNSVWSEMSANALDSFDDTESCESDNNRLFDEDWNGQPYEDSVEALFNPSPLQSARLSAADSAVKDGVVHLE